MEIPVDTLAVEIMVIHVIVTFIQVITSRLTRMMLRRLVSMRFVESFDRVVAIAWVIFTLFWFAIVTGLLGLVLGVSNEVVTAVTWGLYMLGNATMMSLGTEIYKLRIDIYLIPFGSGFDVNHSGGTPRRLHTSRTQVVSFLIFAVGYATLGAISIISESKDAIELMTTGTMLHFILWLVSSGGRGDAD